jgi:hypothetical protein
MIATRNQQQTHAGKVIPRKELLTMRDRKQEFNEDGSRNALFFTAALITRYNEITDKREVVVIDYRKDGTGELQIKFPGVESMKEETPIAALIRGIKKETSFTIYGTRARLINQRQYFSRESGELTHAKLFFSYEYRYYPGTLKQQPNFLKKVVILPGAEYSNPRWEVIDQRLLDTLFQTHQYALHALMRMR